MITLKGEWQKIRKTFAKINKERDRHDREDWKVKHPKEYAKWLDAGCPDIFIYEENKLDE